jgi:hypothetical protein
MVSSLQLSFHVISLFNGPLVTLWYALRTPSLGEKLRYTRLVLVFRRVNVMYVNLQECIHVTRANWKS